MEAQHKCPNCNEDYDTVERIIVALEPCGHFICKECASYLVNPLSSGNYLQCGLEHNKPVKIKEFVGTTQTREQLESRVRVKVYCDKHEYQRADYLEEQSRNLICWECAYGEGDKISVVSNIDQKLEKIGESILKSCNYQEEHIRKLTQELEVQKQLGNQLLSKSETFSGSEIMKLILKANEYFESNQIQNNLSENDLIRQAWMFHDSLIVGNSPAQRKLMRGWLEDRYVKCELLYRASIHGWNASSFHQKCDKKGASVTLVETSERFKFGGFTTQDFQSANNFGLGQWVNDGEAFAFSLTKSTKLPIKQEQKQYAVQNNYGWLPVFGHEFLLASDCNQNENSSSNIGGVYNAPGGIVHNTEAAKTYMAGKVHFRVKEVEVYSLKNN